MIALLCIVSTMVHGQGTRVGFYATTCPKAESIVKSTVKYHLNSDPTLAAALLRMHFHDCFVQGCDTSVLVTGFATERTAFANLGLRGFKVIDNTKTQLEAACPSVVSCADIVALATRDSVILSVKKKSVGKSDTPKKKHNVPHGGIDDKDLSLRTKKKKAKRYVGRVRKHILSQEGAGNVPRNGLNTEEGNGSGGVDPTLKVRDRPIPEPVNKEGLRH
ncbi:hypothetical protein Ahy_A09g043302 [Arachis hypogaea]|uniref:peroxidase n=1 Tax=Arachis hypogaea TaxID=3818 RepID=A0A445BI00_ARAHY|nr:hypothetical protein Ahy_A09g043302 [Arachis hypogaea]